MAGLGVITVEGQTRQLTPRSTAPVFSSSASYAVGDLVYNDGTLYKCTTAHSGVWNASHFTAVTVSGELQAKEAEIDDVKTDLTKTKSLDYTKTTPIYAGDNLNNYNTPGNFYIANGTIASSVSNLPPKMSNFAGRLTVETLNNSAAILQTYTITSKNTDSAISAKRLFGGGAWTDWHYDVSNEYVAKFANLLAFDRGATAIPSNADLNNYKTPGNYYIASATIASTVSNLPYSVSGALTVKTLNHAQAILQEYTTTSVIGDGNIKAYRLFSSGAWKEWIKPYTKILADRENRDAIVLYDKMAIAGTSEAVNVIRKMLSYDIKFANATAPLWLVNYTGNTQNCHPKVLYFENGFGGHKYWMAYTPYPYCNDDYENPCIAYSDDGYHFTNINGNPLDDPKGNGYNSDTHLVYNTNTQKMEVWWRYVNDSTPQETIYRMTTSDGTSWSAKEIVYNNTSGTQTNFQSPCVIYENGTYKIWVCTYANGVRYYEAPESDITNWTLIRSLSFTIQDEGINVTPWHIDVIKENGSYIMAIMCRNGSNLTNNICSVFIATSSDNITYDAPYKVISGNVGIWDKVLYRTCILKTPTGYRLYYTGETGGNTTIYGDARWGIGISESDTLTNFYGVCKDTRVT